MLDIKKIDEMYLINITTDKKLQVSKSKFNKTRFIELTQELQKALIDEGVQVSTNEKELENQLFNLGEEKIKLVMDKKDEFDLLLLELISGGMDKVESYYNEENLNNSIDLEDFKLLISNEISKEMTVWLNEGAGSSPRD